MSKLKYTTEEMEQRFNEGGCELLDKYQGAQVKMKYRCSCGRESQISWNNFSAGKRCGYCGPTGRKKKYTLEEMQIIFKKRGAEFLDDNFKGIHHKHRYRCKCGKEAEITFAGFYHQNQDCFECGRKKNIGPRNHMWRADREKVRLDKIFRKKCYKALRSSLEAVGQKKLGHTSDMLGYGPKELQEYITNHPNWEHVKDVKWHLDHIYPIQAFIDHEIDDMSIINCLENLQPITSHANQLKRDKYNEKEFLEWVQHL